MLRSGIILMIREKAQRGKSAYAIGDEGGADDVAFLGADEGVDVGSDLSVASGSSMASSDGDDVCSFSAVDSTVSAGSGDCVSAEKMICSGSSCVAATLALTVGFPGVTGITLSSSSAL